MDQSSSFHALLEKYVFAVVTELIDQVSPPEQAQLINLFHSIDATPPDPVIPVTGSPLPELEAQWQQALKPVAKKARQSGCHFHTEERKALVQQSRALNQAQIESTRLVIARLDQLIGRAEETLASQSLRRQTLSRYQRLRTQYVTQLDRLTQFALASPHLNER
jgi:chemotaxis protein histidine kinase CheA